MSDQVNRPSHYTSGKIEVIDFIEDQGLGFHLGNVVKYVARAGKKDPTKELQDLQKAAWYLSRYCEKLQISEGVDAQLELSDTQSATAARVALRRYNDSRS